MAVLKRDKYRRRRGRHRSLWPRVTRVTTIASTALRSVPTATMGVATYLWAVTVTGWVPMIIPAVLTLWDSARSTRSYRPRGKRSRLRPVHHRTEAPVPAAVTAAVADLAPRFGLRPHLLQVIVQSYGKGKLADLPLAAAAGWFGGGLIIVDDDLAKKAQNAGPGTKADDEVRGVIAHELAHIYALDSIAVTTARFSVAGIVTSVAAVAATGWYRTGTVTANLIAGLVAVTTFGLLLTVLLERAAARACEFRADRFAVKATGDSRGLVSALLADFDGTQPGWRRWFAQHPETRSRVQRLRTTGV